VAVWRGAPCGPLRDRIRSITTVLPSRQHVAFPPCRNPALPRQVGRATERERAPGRLVVRRGARRATRRGFPPWLFAALCAVVAHTARGDTNEVRAPLPFARYSNDQIQPLRTDAPVDGVTQWLASLSITNGLSGTNPRTLLDVILLPGGAHR